MPAYHITFAGLSVAISYDDNTSLDFLHFLFADLHDPTTDTIDAVDTIATILHIGKNNGSEEYNLADRDKTLLTSVLGVQFAGVLFDQVIFHLLNHRKDGVALHTGAVSYQEQTILLPGQSGSGKSSVSACLIADQCSYLTDELVFLPENKPDQVIPFPRPLCIKPGAVAAITTLLPKGNEQHILNDKHGAVVPHRLLNPDFTLQTSAPALLLFPVYQPDTRLHVEKISAARATSLLMACDVNARNLEDHGFNQIVRLARATPARRLAYSGFAGINDLPPVLFTELEQR